MKRYSSAVLAGLLLMSTAAAAASTAAYGTLRRDAIQAVSVCRNLSTVTRQLDGLAEDVVDESKTLQTGALGRIAVVQKRLDVIDGKVDELERKSTELHELSQKMKDSALELQKSLEADQPTPPPPPATAQP